ncbi:MAG: hypothetical protein HFG42_01130 [Lachnospiraceae bacterium]|nr:hypothetical protein [Lachnospiraceae bacterium]
MKKFFLRTIILLLIFISAVAGYFIWIRNHNLSDGSRRVYTVIQESTFPVMYMEMYGEKMNCLHGYSQDMREAVMRDTLTILPEDRRLPILLEDYDGSITGIYYEIRSLDLDRLVERTQIETWTETENGIRAELPIQNLLAKDQEYLLSLSVTTSENGTIGYYTRIKWTDNTNIQAMIDLAKTFSSKTFNYQEAAQLTMYLEPDATADNSNLGEVSINCSFSQITWGGLDVELGSRIEVSLKELDGIMGQIELQYLATHQTEDGRTETYEVTDDFTLKWNEQRIYMMDFDRRVNEIFTGNRDCLSGKRILLGITADDKVSAKSSPNGKQIGFRTNRDLWLYDQDNRDLVSIFSFRSQENSSKVEYDQHDVKILQVSDNGDVDFLVYGYMNRGRREGQVGIGLYHYSDADSALEERFFAPFITTYEDLRLDLDKLCYQSQGGMLYLMQDHAVYGIDLNSSEYIILADSLEEGAYAVSQDGRHFAWQDGHKKHEAVSVSLMDLETGVKQTISAPEGDYIRSLGFVGGDFLYGLARQGSRWVVNNRLEEIPMYALEVLGEDSQILTRYEKEGYYISGVSVEDSRIHLKRIVQELGNSYIMVDKDTIVCNAEIENTELEGIGWYASSDKEKVYFVQLSFDIKASQDIDLSGPRKVSYDQSLDLGLVANTPFTRMTFYAYGNGRLRGITQDFKTAVELAYEDMGLVTDEDQNILWNRVNRGNTKSIRDPQNVAYRITQNLDDFTESKEFPDGTIMLDAKGLAMNQILYFVDQGCPVIAYTGEKKYLFISGFDQYNVTLYQPETGESWKMGLNDASSYFQNLQNDFVCGIISQ